MSRRHSAEKREIIPDAKYGDIVVAKFMNTIMYEGKKSVAERIVYGALDSVEAEGQERSAGGLQAGARERRAGGRGPFAPRRRRDLSGAGRGAHRPPSGAGDPLDHFRRPRPQRQDHGRPPFRRAARRLEQSRRRGEEARRHAPHGGSQPRLRPLSLVSSRRSTATGIRIMARSHAIEDYRNFGIMAHIDVGQDDHDRAHPVLHRKRPKDRRGA